MKCQPGCTCNRHQARSAEVRAAISEKLTGVRKGDTDSYLMNTGYRMLTGRRDHPLADKRGEVLEHRAVLYEKLGPGDHPCFWCGKVLGWGGVQGICCDHLDEDKLNNSPGNLEPSCLRCNGWRNKPPKVRDPKYVPGTAEVRAYSAEKSRRHYHRKKDQNVPTC